MENLDVLERETLRAASLQPDLILWPEAATPFPILDNDNHLMLDWIQRLVNHTDIPLLSGNIARFEKTYYNGVFLVEPEFGLVDAFYFKRRLVPFGEYVPFREYLPFLGKIVPLEGDATPGSVAQTIPVTLNNGVWNAGPLICNEDGYPWLARDYGQSRSRLALCAHQ